MSNEVKIVNAENPAKPLFRREFFTGIQRGGEQYHAFG
jgi:hypothetical protein